MSLSKCRSAMSLSENRSAMSLSGGLMTSIGEEFFFKVDSIPGVNHLREMQYQIVIDIALWTDTVVQMYVHNSYTKQ